MCKWSMENKIMVLGIITAFMLGIPGYAGVNPEELDVAPANLHRIATVDPVDNPELSKSCGLDIVLVMDESGSIGSTEFGQIQDALITFVNAFLPATPTEFALVDFASTAVIRVDFTNDAAAVINGINEDKDTNIGTATNWEDALIKTNDVFQPNLNRTDKPDLVVFASDGNPTDPVPNALDLAITQANNLKQQGIRILTIGIGDALTTDNLEAISGPGAVITSDFGQLAADMAALAAELCGGTITVRKIIDQDGNLQTTADQIAGGSGWLYELDVQNGTADPTSDTTDNDGLVNFKISLVEGYAQVEVKEYVNPGYILLGATCQGATNDGNFDGDDSIDDISVGRNDIVTCRFYNYPIPEEDDGCKDYYPELLAKASPDECFTDVGQPYPKGPPCNDGVPKVNQAYVWGMTKCGPNIVFGTAPNVHCLVMGGYLGSTGPTLTNSYVCEFGESLFSPPLPPEIGDWRPPDMFVYNTETKMLTELTPQLDPRVGVTMGIRSAGSFGNVAFLAGPSLIPYGTINVFAYNCETGDYLGSKNLPYPNIRKWLVAKGALYTAAGTKVLRWVGNINNPFQFVEVGDLIGSGAELTYNPDDDRIYISTWPSMGGELAGDDDDDANLNSPPPTMPFAGLWMSPPLGPDGLNSPDAPGWIKVWSVLEYEPDFVTAATYGGGALAYYDGYIYWGTMHVPFLATLAHFNVYGDPNNPVDLIKTAFGSHRAISIFRGRNFSAMPTTVDVDSATSISGREVNLLYGEFLLPTYIPGEKPSPGDAVANGPAEEGHWEFLPNHMFAHPLYGPSGFGNFFNNYTWTMAVHNDELFVGTMDWSYLAFGDLADIIEDIICNDMNVNSDEIASLNVLDNSEGLMETFLEETTNLTLDGKIPNLPLPKFGADLYRFNSSTSPALPVHLRGVGNYTNYGIRTMIADDGLYLGTANPMNLLTDLTDDKPEGGWELRELLQCGEDICGEILFKKDFEGRPQDPDDAEDDAELIALNGDKYNHWHRDDKIPHCGCYSKRGTCHRDGCFAVPYKKGVDTRINADNAGLVVDFWYRKHRTESGDFRVFYRGSQGWIYIADLSDGPDDVWLHYTDIVTDPQFFVEHFKVGFCADLGDDNGAADVDNAEATCCPLKTLCCKRVWVDDITIAYDPLCTMTLETFVVSGEGTVTPGGVTEYSRGCCYGEPIVVDLEAMPAPWWKLAAWQGTDNDSSTANANTVTMYGDKQVLVFFDQIQYTLTTQVLPSNAAGTILPASGGLYFGGTTVPLFAQPNPGWKILGWSSNTNDPLAGETNSVLMDDNKNVIVYMEQVVDTSGLLPPPPPVHDLTVIIQGGGGTVDPAGTNSFRAGVIPLQAAPDQGFRVKGWNGTNNDSNPTDLNTVMLDKDKTVVLEFEPIPVVLNYNQIGDGGTIPATSGTFVIGSEVPLSATPDPGYQVKKWVGSDDDSTTDPNNVVTLDKDKNVFVEFEPIKHTLTLNMVGAGGVLPMASGLLNQGTVQPLFVRLAPDFRVRSWQGTDDDDHKMPSNEVTMSTDKVVTVAVAAVNSPKKFQVKGNTLRFIGAKFRATKEQLEPADFINITVLAGNDVVFQTSIPFDVEQLKKDRIFNYKAKGQGVTNFKFDLKKDTYSFTAKGVNLPGDGPFFVDIEIGEYVGLAEIAPEPEEP